MKYSALKIVPAIFIPFVILSSCQQEPDANILRQPVCTVIKSFTYDNGNIDDSAIYIYNNNQLSRINTANGHIILEYNNNKLIKRNIFDTLVSPYAYDAIDYNADGTVKNMDVFISSGAGFYKIAFYEFTYNAGKLLGVKEKFDTSGNGSYVDITEYTYRYNGDNIDRCIVNDKVNSVSDTLIYHYDNQPNYFQKQNPNSFFTDYFFFQTDPSTLPLALSKNNVTLVEVTGDTFLFTYVEYPDKYLKEVLIDGEIFTRYFHECK